MRNDYQLTRREFLRGMGATILSIPLTGLSEKVFAYEVNHDSNIYEILKKMNGVDNIHLRNIQELDREHVSEVNKSMEKSGWRKEEIKAGVKRIIFADYKDNTQVSPLRISYKLFKNEEVALKLSLLDAFIAILTRTSLGGDDFMFIRKDENFMFSAREPNFLKSNLLQEYKSEFNRKGIRYIDLNNFYNKTILAYFRGLEGEKDPVKIELITKKLLEERLKPVKEFFEEKNG